MKLRLWLSNVFFGVALCCFGMYAASMYQIVRPLKVPTVTAVKDTGALRARSIRIASLHIDLPIYDTAIFDTHWQTSAVGVSHLTSSPIPGETGNSILYAHNWPNLFGRLPGIKRGDTIRITFSNDSVKDFHVDTVHTVLADDTSVLAQTAFPQITLYTCIGIFDTRRMVITAR